MGGKPFNAIRIKKYVEPQTIYIVANDSMTRNGDAFLVFGSAIFWFWC